MMKKKTTEISEGSRVISIKEFYDPDYGDKMNSGWIGTIRSIQFIGNNDDILYGVEYDNGQTWYIGEGYLISIGG